MGNRSDLIDEFLKALESAPDFYNTLGGWMQGTADLSGPEESEEFKKALGCFFRSSVILLGVLYRGNGKKFPKVSRTFIVIKNKIVVERQSITSINTDNNARGTRGTLATRDTLSL